MRYLQIQVLGLRFRFSFWFFVTILAFVLLDREVIFFYMALPIAIHEMAHLFVLLLCGVVIEEITFTPVSIAIKRIHGRMLGYGQELAVTLAGVTANALMALFLYLFTFQSMRTMFLIAANVAVALFNLLPIGNLDGGDVVRLLAERLGAPGIAWKISRITSILVLIPLIATAVLLCLLGTPNITMLFACAYLTLAVVMQKD